MAAKKFTSRLANGTYETKEILAIGLARGGVVFHDGGGAEPSKVVSRFMRDTRSTVSNYRSRDAITALKFGSLGKDSDGRERTGLALGRATWDYPGENTTLLEVIEPSKDSWAATAGEPVLWWGRADVYNDDRRAPYSFDFGRLSNDSQEVHLAVGWIEDGMWHAKCGLEITSKKNINGSAVRAPACRPKVTVHKVLDSKGEKLGRNAAPLAQSVDTRSEGHWGSDPAAVDSLGTRPADAVQFVPQPDGKSLILVSDFAADKNYLLSPPQSAGGTLKRVAFDEGKKELTGSDMRSWFPGYKNATIKIENTSQTEVEVQLNSSADPTRGCWSQTRIDNGTPALPNATPVLVKAGQTTGSYNTSARVSGDCASGDNRYAFLTVQPAGKPELRTTVKIEVKSSDSATRLVLNSTQFGNGALSFALTPVSEPSKANLGSYTLTVKKAADAPTPDPDRLPEAVATRLTAEKDPDSEWDDRDVDHPDRPVYRIDVKGPTWIIPNAGQPHDAPDSNTLTEAVLPPMTVRGSADDGKNWTDLGQLRPTTQPTRDPAKPTHITLGASTFYWQNTLGAPTYTSFAIHTGNAQTPHTTVNLTPTGETPETLKPPK
ncbi:hypothetical protein ACFWBC_40260, partial [Streptomyces sp. NPDC059985]|uniref:hypothetical protein n=1 Tax=Streptomyces sp. NPDC059985 TaxID=3347025 RepID=UPI0036A59B6E